MPNLKLSAAPDASDHELWRDLCEKDDRTSPEEYPDMALINEDEFLYVCAAVRRATVEQCVAEVYGSAQAPNDCDLCEDIVVRLRALSPTAKEPQG